MFLRISGSSSMTSIFFMVRSKNGKLDDHSCPFANFAVHLHLPVMQVGAAFHQQQAESGSRTGSYVAPPIKGLKQLLLIVLRNANPPIADDADRVAPVALN